MSVKINGSTGITTPNIISPTQTISTKLDLTGGQIKFPATQVASSDANTLDDYEEGTWTPTVTAVSGSGQTYSFQAGHYIKVGNLVSVNCVFRLSSKGTLSGQLFLSGLPFQIDSSKNTMGNVILGGEYLAATKTIGGQLNGGTTSLTLTQQINTTSDITVLFAADFTNTSGIKTVFTYHSI